MDGLNRDLNDYDLIIKNGTLVDVTWIKPGLLDVAIINGVISSIGVISGKANQ